MVFKVLNMAKCFVTFQGRSVTPRRFGVAGSYSCSVGTWEALSVPLY